MSKFLVTLLLANLISVQASSARQGNSVGNGGNIEAAEFTSLARDIIGELIKTRLQKEDRRILNQLKKGLDEVYVGVGDEINICWSGGSENIGSQYDALNYPTEKYIVINRANWPKIRASNSKSVTTFILHEYLSVLEIPDKHYEISTRLADLHAKLQTKRK